ncbi:heat shock protein 30C-like [Emydura macquarii macquarii]|uniref:heat shock protein 30C-like n=1 Tax=Emydura macquarii macquarii TaxID=1129001 RepID=UPI003529EB92
MGSGGRLIPCVGRGGRAQKHLEGPVQLYKACPGQDPASEPGESSRTSPGSRSMTSCSRYLVRLLPLRRWPLRGFGPTWGCSSEPGSLLLGPAPQSIFETVVGDMRRHVEEMERISRAVFEAHPLLSWEPVGRRGLGESGTPPAADAEKEPGSPGPREGTFRLSMDVAGFSPEELTVRMEGRRVTVTGKREKQSMWEEGGLSREYRELRREAVLPEDVDLQAVTCSLSRDGQLCIKAPRLAQPAAEGRAMPIGIQQEEEDGAGKEPPSKEGLGTGAS